MQRLAGRVRRKKGQQARRDKAVAKQKYMEYYESLPVREDLVILEARNGKTVDGNIFYIAAELMEDPAYRGLDVYLVCADEASEEEARRKMADFPHQPHTVLLQTEEYYRIMASAGYIVNDSAIRNFFIKKPGQVYLNVWHGTPLKTMGKRVRSEPHAVGSVQKNFIIADYLLYPSEYMMEHMIEDYMLEDCSQAVCLLGGYPRNSVFFDADQGRRMRAELGLEGKRIYAYMPTWRPEEDGRVLRGILQEMDMALQEDEVLLVNIHPLAAGGADLSAYRRIQAFPAGAEVYQVLNACDGLVTDYSSVFYDYAVTGRGIVLLAYDEESYFRDRGLYEPLESLPFPRVGTAAEALESLRGKADYADSGFLQRFCRYESADAARLLCAEVFLGERHLERRGIGSNGRENVLVYGGDLKPSARTDALMDFLADPDKPQANYYLTFNRRDVNESKDLLLRLPEGIRHIGRTGAVTLTQAQQKKKEAYLKGEIPFEEYWQAVRPAYRLERERYYGSMPISRVVQIPPGRQPGPEATEEELEFSAYGL